MNKLSTNYKAVLEGKMNKFEFVRQARNMFPNLINQYTTFDDSITILNRKGMLSEEMMTSCKANQFPLEQVEKGIDIELAKMGICPDCETPTLADYRKAKKAAIDNLSKNSLYYVELIASEEKDKNPHVAKQEYLQEIGLHKDVDLTKDPDEDIQPEIQKKKQTVKKEILVDTHDWTVDQYKIAYIMAEFGKDGNAAIVKHFGYNTTEIPTDVWIGINIIGTTADGMSFAKQGMAKIISGEGENIEASEFLKSYFGNNKAIQAYEECKNKSLNDIINSLNIAEVPTEDRVKDLTDFHEKKLENLRDKKQVKVRKASQIRQDIERMARNNSLSLEKAEKIFKIKYPEEYEIYRSQYNKGILREAISKSILRVLNEAATVNLAQISDENVSIQNLPGLVNALENVVTEIETFITKEQVKIQNIFDQIGNIKNEDNIVIGYRFVDAILDSFRKDLEPVMNKASLDNIKLPEGPKDEIIHLNTGLEDEPLVAAEEEKEMVYSPRGSKPKINLDENRKSRKYTR